MLDIALFFFRTEIVGISPSELIASGSPKFSVELSLGPRHNKTCLWGFRHRGTQTSILSYRDYIENRNFAGGK